MFLVNIREIFKNTYFEEHLRTAASGNNLLLKKAYSKGQNYNYIMIYQIRIVIMIIIIIITMKRSKMTELLGILNYLTQSSVRSYLLTQQSQQNPPHLLRADKFLNGPWRYRMYGTKWKWGNND